MHHPIDRIEHTSAFVTPVVEGAGHSPEVEPLLMVRWLERELWLYGVRHIVKFHSATEKTCCC